MSAGQGAAQLYPHQVPQPAPFMVPHGHMQAEASAPSRSAKVYVQRVCSHARAFANALRGMRAHSMHVVRTLTCAHALASSTLPWLCMRSSLAHVQYAQPTYHIIMYTEPRTCRTQRCTRTRTFNRIERGAMFSLQVCARRGFVHGREAGGLIGRCFRIVLQGRGPAFLTSKTSIMQQGE